MRRVNRLILAAAVALLPSIAQAKTFNIDAGHTTVGFRVRHLFTEVGGRFGTFEGTIEFDAANPVSAKVKGTIDAASIDTYEKDRDGHLRGAEFFDVAKHPKISFESTKVTDVDSKAMTAKVHGNLTIHGVTKPVVLDAAFGGEASDPWGNKKAGFSAETSIDRRDYGLTWNKALEAGNFLVGNDVKIRIDAEVNEVEAAKAETRNQGVKK